MKNNLTAQKENKESEDVLFGKIEKS